MEIYYHSTKFEENYTMQVNSRESIDVNKLSLPSIPKKNVVKSKTMIGQMSLSSKYKPTINCQDFWSAKMKAEIWKFQKSQILKKTKIFLEKTEDNQAFTGNIKSKFLRKNHISNFKSERTDEVPTIEGLIWKCEKELKKPRRFSEKFEFHERNIQRKLTNFSRALAD